MVEASYHHHCQNEHPENDNKSLIIMTQANATVLKRFHTTFQFQTFS